MQGDQDTHNNQILFDFGIMVKRYHNKIKEGHTYSRHCSSATVFYTVLFLCITIHNHCRCSCHLHTCIILLTPSLIKHTLSKTIICKTHAHILLQNAQSHTHSNTVMHTVGSCLSEAVTVGLWSSEAGVVRTVAVLERNKASAKHRDDEWITVYDDRVKCVPTLSRRQTKWYITNYKLIKMTEFFQNL